MANRQVPKFSLNNCAESSKKTFTCPKFCTNPVSKHTQSHISTNLSNFLKLWLQYCQKLFALAPTNRRFAEENRLSGSTAQSYKKTFMCPKFHTNPALKYTKCHTSTNLLNFLKLCLPYCQNLFALAPTNCQFAEKNWLS